MVEAGPNPVISANLHDCSLESHTKQNVETVEGIRAPVFLKFDPGLNSSAFVASEVEKQIREAPLPSNPLGIDLKLDTTISVRSKLAVGLTQSYQCEGFSKTPVFFLL